MDSFDCFACSCWFGNIALGVIKMDRKIFLVLLLFAIPLISSATCNSNWQCSNWSDCVANKQIRACGDLTSCNNESSRPPEERFCGTTCNPVWNCTSWEPEKCPENTTQTRTCADSNNCGKLDGKPEEIQICEFQRDFSWIYYFIVAVTVILILGSIWILIRKFKGKD